MRKIISILVTLGVVLGLSIIAAPAAAQICTATVSLDSECAGATGVAYTIDFLSPVTLLEVNDFISVDFGPGTTFAFSADGDIDVDGSPVDKEDVVVTGTKVVFPVPFGHGIINPGDPVTVTIIKVRNPSIADDYVLNLDYDLACCPGVTFGCAEYTIIPARSTYDFVWDSSPTYPGLALGFVPPFKACGQENFPGEVIDGKFANYFDLLFTPTLIGCLGPCTSNMTFTLTLTAAPAGSNVTLSLNGTVHNLVPTALDPQPDLDLGSFDIGFNTTLNWSNAIHFDMVGSYQICLEAECPAVYECPECSEDPMIIDECFDIEVYQWKTALKIPLARKWNLISLPLVPLVADQPIEDVLKALPNYDTLIKSIHYYDGCTGGWSVWGNGQTSLATLEDGKSYWVKVEYSHTDPTKAPGLSVGGLWVWGTPQPVPPASPSAYPVCEGWNMVGLTGYAFATDPVNYDAIPDTTDDAYLWNWVGAGPSYQYGVIFGWNPGTQVWWSLTPDTNTLPNLQTGEGYWIPFAHDGMIYPV